MLGPGKPSLRVEDHREEEPQPDISPAAIRAEFARILGSVAFRGSDRLKRFLEFTVEQTLGGHSGEFLDRVTLCYGRFRMFCVGRGVQPATMIGFKQIEFFDHTGSSAI